MTTVTSSSPPKTGTPPKGVSVSFRGPLPGVEWDERYCEEIKGSMWIKMARKVIGEPGLFLYRHWGSRRWVAAVWAKFPGRKRMIELESWESHPDFCAQGWEYLKFRFRNVKLQAEQNMAAIREMMYKDRMEEHGKAEYDREVKKWYAKKGTLVRGDLAKEDNELSATLKDILLNKGKVYSSA